MQPISEQDVVKRPWPYGPGLSSSQSQETSGLTRIWGQGHRAMGVYTKSGFILAHLLPATPIGT